MIAERSLADLLSAIASRERSPGAGASAGVALALGIACARKAAVISLGHEGEHPHLDGVDARLAEIGEAALRFADRDAELFQATLSHAPGAAEALEQHGGAFVALITTAREAVDRAAVAIDANVRGDILAAQVLIAAAGTITRANLAENRT